MKNDEIFNDLPNLFGTADDISIVGNVADARDDDKTLRQVMLVCH